MKRLAVVCVFAAVIAVVVLAVAGCGGASDESGDAEDQTPVTSTGAPGSGDQRRDATDQERAERMVVAISDLPPGWRATTKLGDESGCLDLDAGGVTVTGRAGPDDYEGTATPAVAMFSEGAVYASGADAEEIFALLSSEQSASCVGSFISGQSDEDRTFTASVAPLTIPGLDEASGWRITIEVESSDGERATAYFDIVTIKRERAITVVSFGGAQQPFSPTLEAEITTAVARRMEP